MHKFKHFKLPDLFSPGFCPGVDIDNLKRREDQNDFATPLVNFHQLARSPHLLLIKDWNNLPSNIKATADYQEFLLLCKEFFLTKYETECLIDNCYSCNYSIEQ